MKNLDVQAKQRSEYIIENTLLSTILIPQPRPYLSTCLPIRPLGIMHAHISVTQTTEKLETTIQSDHKQLQITITTTMMLNETNQVIKTTSSLQTIIHNTNVEPACLLSCLPSCLLVVPTLFSPTSVAATAKIAAEAVASSKKRGKFKFSKQPLSIKFISSLGAFQKSLSHHAQSSPNPKYHSIPCSFSAPWSMRPRLDFMSLKEEKKSRGIAQSSCPARSMKMNFGGFGLFRPICKDPLVVLLSHGSFDPGGFAIQGLVLGKKEACSARVRMKRSDDRNFGYPV